MLQSTLEHRYTLVPAGHGVGKSFLATGSSLHFAYTHTNSRVLLFGPTFSQLDEVLWAELADAWTHSSVKLPGRLIGGNSPKLLISDKWGIWGSSVGGDGVSKAGRHAGRMLVVCDEASSEGYDDLIEDLEGLNASNYLFIGNPLRHGRFKSLCDMADAGRPAFKKINISSLDSPHAHLDRSPVGLADRGYLDNMRLTYGEDSPQWRARVLGIFNDEDEFALIPNSWLDSCDYPHPGRRGTVKIAIDLSKGSGGNSDNSVILVLDEAGILDLIWGNTWGPEETARRVKETACKWSVDPSNIVFDATGLGMDFQNRLDAQGLRGCKAYVGTSKLRSQSAWAMRMRLDPDRTLFPQADPRILPKSSLNHLFGVIAGPAPEKPQPHKQAGFSIRSEWLQRLRPELTGLRYKLGNDGGIVLEPKAELAKRLGHSPDLADALLIAHSI